MRSSLLRFVLLAVAILFFSLHCTVQATCFYPNGEEAPSSGQDAHSPCDPSATSGTTCCANDFQCLSNGLCNDYRYQNYTRVLRGACTDDAFGGACNKVCTDYWPQGDEAVWYCGDGNYCCSRDDSCCGDSNVQKTNLGVPTVVAIAGKTTPKSTTTRPSSTAAATSTSNPSGSQSSSQTSSQRSTPVPVAVGIGVGVGVFLFLLIATGCWYLRRRRKRNAPPVLHELSATTPAISHASPGQNYTFDDKAGGWTSSPSSPWSRRVSTGRNSNVVHEAGPGMVQTSDKRIELHSPVEYTEMPGYNPPIEMQGMSDHKGLTRPELAITEEQRRLSDSRRSRFVEGVETGRPGAGMGSGMPMNMSGTNTVATEGDVEGLQRRLRELGR